MPSSIHYYLISTFTYRHVKHVYCRRHKRTSISCCSNPWHSETSAALNGFIGKVRLQWVYVVMKYVCQFVCQSSLVVGYVSNMSCLLPMTLPAFFVILSNLSLSCFEIFPPQQTQRKISTN